MLVAAATLMTSSADAADPVSISHAVYVPPSGTGLTATPAHVEIVLASTFGTPAAVAQAGDKTKYRIVDLYAGPGRTYGPKELPIDRAVVPPLPPLAIEQLNTVQLFLPASLPATEDDRYILIVSGLQIGKQNVPVTASPTPVTMQMVTPTAIAPQWVKAKNKDAADVYFSGSVSRSAGKDFYGNADLKFRFPMLERDIGNRLHSFAPAFDLMASDNPDGDPDTVRLGGVWQFFPISKLGTFLPVTRWENAVEQEASRNFDYRNVIWRSELLFLPPPASVAGGMLWVNPLVGIAAGSIVEVPDAAIESGSLFRLLGGVSATLDVPAFFAKRISITGEYQIRRQFQDEYVGAVTLREGSHPWLSAKAEVAFNNFVSFGAVYQDGRQPPKYKEVDRSLAFDLTFKAARKNKPQ